MHFISTQTASSSASLSWTGLGTTYNTYWMNCNGLLAATNGANLDLQFGEGATPTWETASYSFASNPDAADDTNFASDESTSSGGVELAYDVSNASKNPININAWIHDLPSTTLYKSVDWISTFYYDVSDKTLEFGYGGGDYEGDTGAVTAIRVLFSSGNISSGTCSLYGMN